jgi:hypothetical protein
MLQVKSNEELVTCNESKNMRWKRPLSNLRQHPGIYPVWRRVRMPPLYPCESWKAKKRESGAWRCNLATLSPGLMGLASRGDYFLLFLVGWDLCPLGTAATVGLLYQPQMIDDGDCGAVVGMRIGRGNRSTRRKLALAPLCLPQISHDLTRAAAVWTATNCHSCGAARLGGWTQG